MFVLHSIKSYDSYKKSTLINNGRVGNNIELFARDTDTGNLIEILTLEELYNVYGVAVLGESLMLVTISEDDWKALDYIESANSIPCSTIECKKPLYMTDYRTVSFSLNNKYNAYYLKDKNVLVVEDSKFYLVGSYNSIIVKQVATAFTAGTTLYEFLRHILEVFPELWKEDKIIIYTVNNGDYVKYVFKITSKFRAFVAKKLTLKK